jgi:hypothetical protein
MELYCWNIDFSKYFVGIFPQILFVNLLEANGYFSTTGFKIQISTWCSHCVYMFGMDLRTNRNFWLVQH